MPMRFATHAAFCLGLVVAASAGISAAYADSSYEPYYVNRDTLLFANPAPPMNNGAYAARPDTPGIPQPWQKPEVTVATNPVEAQFDTTPQAALYHYNNEVWASAGTSYFNYKEAFPGPIPDSEKGWLPTISAGGDYMTHDHLYLAIEGSDSFGDARYNGSRLDTNTDVYDIPYQGTTRETIVSADGKIGQGFFVANQVMLIPYLDIGWRWWHRDLGFGQIETYDNFAALGGLQAQYAITNRFILSGYGAGGSTMGAKMTSGDSTFDLGSDGTFKTGAKFAFEMTPQVELFTTFDYDYLRYAHSAMVAVGTNGEAMEPGSRTEDTAFRVGLGYHFR